MAFNIWSRQSQAKRIINIGLDFGTSSSKVIWRDATGDRLTALGFDNGMTGYPAVSMPSSLKISGDRVYFGIDAETERTPGWLVRSLKVCVACRAGAVRCRECQPADAQKRAGEFYVHPSGTLGAEELAPLLIGYMMRTARHRVESGYRLAKDATFTWNMSAPLDQYEFGRLRETFERLAYVGSRVAGDIKSGMRLADGLEMVRHVARTPLPARGELPVSIVPEAIAAVHAYCQSPVAEPGLYALVDVGAGTTTVSFFRYHRASEKPITCYSSCTDAVGADDVDRAIAGSLEQRYPALRSAAIADRVAVLHEIRGAKENFSGGLRVGPGFEMSCKEVDDAIRPLIDKMYDVYQSAYRKAYRKESFSDRWADLSVLFVGGGSFIRGVRDAFQEAPHPMVERRKVRLLELPNQLSLDGVRGAALSGPEATLLAVAYGLSFPRVDIPDYWETSEVEPIGVPRGPSPEPEDWR